MRIIDNETVDEWIITINVTLDYNITDVNETEILENISAVCGVDADKIQIVVTVSDDGHSLVIITYVRDKESAEVITETLNQCSDCTGILRDVKSVSVESRQLSLASKSCHEMILLVIISMLIAFFIQ